VKPISLTHLDELAGSWRALKSGALVGNFLKKLGSLHPADPGYWMQEQSQCPPQSILCGTGNLSRSWTMFSGANFAISRFATRHDG
jgi:hypothetical protein